MFPTNTDPAVWARKFLESHPQYEADVNPLHLGLWFLGALEVGWAAGERGEPLDFSASDPNAPLYPHFRSRP